ncbi:MAG: hypothetical protein IJ584_08285 [Bacteroidales bacterium]|nr:hypothetical protein [Bacteroidales bacterium]
MENNSLFPLKYRLRKTNEMVEIVAWETADKGARSESDWVSYIDASGVEHFKEHLTLEWDFVIDSPFEKIISGGFGSSLPAFDPWESRRYELAKEIYFRMDKFEVSLVGYEGVVERADMLIAALKKSSEAEEPEDKYENIGIGEIVDAFSEDGIKHAKKFIFTDRKDIVGFFGDNGRWAYGDKVKVYIKKYEPEKGL